MRICGFTCRQASRIASWLLQLISRSVMGSLMLSTWLTCPGEIEQDVLARDQVLHSVGVPHVRDIHLEPGLDPVDVEEVPAVVRNERVDEEHLGPERKERAGEIASDEAESARDEDLLALVRRAVALSGRAVSRSRAGGATSFMAPTPARRRAPRGALCGSRGRARGARGRGVCGSHVPD